LFFRGHLLTVGGFLLANSTLADPRRPPTVGIGLFVDFVASVVTPMTYLLQIGLIEYLRSVTKK
jgi:hypothetical protein